jgi:hypothetical protein
MILGVAVSMAYTQTYTELGAVSGSGLKILPSTSVAPTAQFRLNTSRIDFLHRGQRGMNIYELSAGFSPNLEGYLKFSTEEYNAISSIASVGFGAKFQLPFSLPVVDRSAIWGETIYSEDDRSTVFPSAINRYGFMSSIEWQYSKAILLFGFSGESNLDRVLLGTGYMIGLNRSLQVGAEILYGYVDNHSIHAFLAGTYRIVSNVSIQMSPGYLQSSSVTTFLFSAGISISTADIDFTPVNEPTIDEFHIPSFEEIEKQTKEEKQ